MQKTNRHIEAETDIQDLNLEEVADIPESISLEKSIEGENAPHRPDNQENDPADGEEMADIRHSMARSVSVEDDFAGRPGHEQRMRPSHVSDISSLASEVDTLTRVSMEKIPTAAGTRPSAPKDGPKRQATSERPAITPAKKQAKIEDANSSGVNEIVINEDDDIDIDYYSLEELEGTAVVDMPEAEFGPEKVVRTEEEPVDGFHHDVGAVQVEDKAEIHVEKDILTFEIPDDVMEKTAEELELGEWEAIDLGEAEKIANEDILFLREEDLIEELEEFDLIPVKTETAAVTTTSRSSKKQERRAGEPLKKREAEAPLREAAVIENHTSEVEKRTVSTIDEVAGSDVVEAVLEVETAGVAENDAGTEIQRTIETLEPVPVGPPLTVEPVAPEPFEEILAEPFPEQKTAESEIRPIDIDEDGEVIILGLEKTSIREDVIPRTGPESPAGHTPPSRQEPAPPRPSFKIVRERIPDELIRIEPAGGSAVFIDDELVDKKIDEKTTIFEVTDLERITSEIVEIIEGEAKLLSEADIADDRDRIASVMKGQTPAFEDLLIDMEGEYSFKDEELDIIDNAFAAEDYGRYIGAIDDLAGGSSEKGASAAVELLGLDTGELGSIEQSSFLKEYEKIDIDGLLASAQAGMDQPASDLDILKRCTYIVAKKGSIFEEERRSIEEDISSGTALVFEESVDEIRARLDAIRGKRCISPEEGIPDISDSVIILDGGRDIERFVESMPEGKRDVMRKLLRYLDGLFEKLPEDVIKNFARSEYFDLYSKVMNDLGV